MQVSSVTIVNVRQFERLSLRFSPGFNLLVGENGAGKTTILRALLAALGSAEQMGRRSRLEDKDIKLRADSASITVDMHGPTNQFGEIHLQKTLRMPAKRSKKKGLNPLTLLYSSNEAICSSMKGKSFKGKRGYEDSSLESNERFLYAYERSDRDSLSGVTEQQFGNSLTVRRFVNEVLSRFSDDMGEFYWRFEPYDCLLLPIAGIERSPVLASGLEKRAQAAAMRWFDEEFLRRKSPIVWPDQAKIVLPPGDRDTRRMSAALPHAGDIWEAVGFTSEERSSLRPYSLEVRLTPRIMIQREVGTLRLDQLSDGEQRLFCLFVDIARQLSVNDPADNIGEGKAIILIDEIDVHLHPKWQRLIVPALEELFQNCQFIATTHSPFVIQATDRQKITPIDSEFSRAYLSGRNSIEDIAENIQGISVPQRSLRAEKLSIAAKEYFKLLELNAAHAEQVTPAQLLVAERSYRDASEPFTEDAATHAFLKILAAEGKA